jgi:hypothetical protein
LCMVLSREPSAGANAPLMMISDSSGQTRLASETYADV